MRGMYMVLDFFLFLFQGYAWLMARFPDTMTVICPKSFRLPNFEFQRPGISQQIPIPNTIHLE